jgi:hypothetical protein
MKRSNTNRTKSISLIGIPIILVVILAYVFTFSYTPEYDELPYEEIIYSSDRYKISSISNWHKIDLSTFSIEVPNDYHFYLEQGMHGGKVGGLTNSKDTIKFVHGRYYFDACEGIVIGEITGRCDTLKVFNLDSKKLVVTQTDSYVGAFVKEDKKGSVFKAWANPTIEKEFLINIFSTVKIKD